MFPFAALLEKYLRLAFPGQLTVVATTSCYWWFVMGSPCVRPRHPVTAGSWWEVLVSGRNVLSTNVSMISHRVSLSKGGKCNETVRIRFNLARGRANWWSYSRWISDSTDRSWKTPLSDQCRQGMDTLQLNHKTLARHIKNSANTWIQIRCHCSAAAPFSEMCLRFIWIS